MSERIRNSFKIINENDTTEIRRLCGSVHSADIARKLSELKVSDVREVIIKINPHKAAHIFQYFSDSLQSKLARLLSIEELAAILGYMATDEQADVLKKLDKHKQNDVLQLMPEKNSKQASALAAYPEGTAGSVMTKSFITLPLTATVAEAKKKVKEFEDPRNLHYIFVTDNLERVCGTLRMFSLIDMDGTIPVSEIADTEIFSVRPFDDQEKAARKLEHYDLLAIAVVDDGGKMLGLITYDDAFEVIIKEQTEDMQKLMAISAGDADNGESYLNISSWQHFKKRILWIVGLAILGLGSGYVLHTYEDVLDALVILAIYMPMLADTGGNTGSQSATLVIRALALGELKARDIFRVIFKEVKISVMISVVLMVLAYAKIAILSGGTTMPDGFSLSQIALAISIALGVQVVSATLIGAVLPIGVSSLKLDPAVIAAPAITSIVDITGLLIYFYTVTTMLGIH